MGSRRSWVRRGRRWLIALLLPAGVVLNLQAGAAAAEADSVVVVDARHDVVELPLDGPHIPRPELAEADIYRVKYRHGLHRIVIRVKAAQFKPANKPYIAGLLTYWDDPIYFQASKVPGKRMHLRLEEYYSDDDSPYVYPCPRENVRMSALRDVIRISIPRRCLNYPPWIEVGLYAGFNDPSGHRVADDPMMVDVGDYEPVEGPLVAAPDGARIDGSDPRLVAPRTSTARSFGVIW